MASKKTIKNCFRNVWFPEYEELSFKDDNNYDVDYDDLPLF